MSGTITVRLGDVDVLVEVQSPVGTEPISKVDEVATSVTNAFQRAQHVIAEVAAATVESVQSAAEHASRPAEVEVSFGLKFSAQGGVIIAGVSSEASLAVKLTYRSEAEM